MDNLYAACPYIQDPGTWKLCTNVPQGPHWAKRTSTRCVTTWTTRKIVNEYCTLPPVTDARCAAAATAAATCDPVLADLAWAIKVSSVTQRIPLAKLGSLAQDPVQDAPASHGCRCASWVFICGPSDSRACTAHKRPDRLALALASVAWPSVRLCHGEGSCVRFRTLGLLGQPMCNRRSSCRTCLQLQALAPTGFVTPKRRPVLKRGPHGTEHKRRSTTASRISLVTREAMNCVHGAGLWRPGVRFAFIQSSGKFKTMPLEQLVVFTPVRRSSALQLHAPSENMCEDRCPYPCPTRRHAGHERCVLPDFLYLTIVCGSPSSPSGLWSSASECSVSSTPCHLGSCLRYWNSTV